MITTNIKDIEFLVPSDVAKSTYLDSLFPVHVIEDSQRYNHKLHELYYKRGIRSPLKLELPCKGARHTIIMHDGKIYIPNHTQDQIWGYMVAKEIGSDDLFRLPPCIAFLKAVKYDPLHGIYHAATRSIRKENNINVLDFMQQIKSFRSKETGWNDRYKHLFPFIPDFLHYDTNVLDKINSIFRAWIANIYLKGFSYFRIEGLSYFCISTSNHKKYIEFECVDHTYYLPYSKIKGLK